MVVVLCLVYGKFIEVWWQKEVVLQSSWFIRFLLVNLVYEVCMLFNVIINYFEIVLEGFLDQEIRDNLLCFYLVLKLLIYVINDLLDFIKIEEGQEFVKDEIFDLLVCVWEGMEFFKNDVRWKGIEYEFIEYFGFLKFVYGD